MFIGICYTVSCFKPFWNLFVVSNRPKELYWAATKRVLFWIILAKSITFSNSTAKLQRHIVDRINKTSTLLLLYTVFVKTKVLMFRLRPLFTTLHIRKLYLSPQPIFLFREKQAILTSLIKFVSIVICVFCVHLTITQLNFVVSLLIMVIDNAI